MPVTLHLAYILLWSIPEKKSVELFLTFVWFIVWFIQTHFSFGGDDDYGFVPLQGLRHLLLVNTKERRNQVQLYGSILQKLPLLGKG